MISEKQLRDLFVEWTGYHIKLYHGEVEETYRVINTIEKPVNGVMTVEAWTYTPIRTIAMATTSATVTIIERSNEEAEKTRKALNDTLEAIRGSAIPVQDDAGRTFLLSVTAGSAYREEVVHGTLYGYGDEYDVVVRLDYIATAYGVSSADTALWIDGNQIEIERVMSNMVYATEEAPGDDGVTTTAVPSKTFQIEASAILLGNAAGDIILREGRSLAEKNKVHCVEYAINNISQYYMMIFTRVQLASSEVNNVGASFTLATASTEAMRFDGMWTMIPNYGNVASIGADEGVTVFWGDHNADRIGVTGMESHVYTDGREYHEIYIFGRYDTPVKRALRVGDNLDGKRLIYVGDDWDVSGEPDSTLISCAGSALAIASGYLRELRDDNTDLKTIGDHILNGQEWVSSLGKVTGIRDATMWQVYVSELGV